MKTNQVNTRPFFFIIAGIFLAMLAPHLFSRGMFMDGLWYATISRNLSIDIGSFWHLEFTPTKHPHFYEHPPLAFGLQYVLFKLIGDSIFVERVYALLMSLLSAWAIYLLWKETVTEQNKKHAWLPLLLWSCIPIVSWGIANNMLENTVTPFACLSVYFFIRSTKTKRFLFLTLSGLALMCGALTKGPVALFPLCAPFFYYLILKRKNWADMLTDTLFVSFITFLPFLLWYRFNSEAANMFTLYFNEQLLKSLNKVETVDSRTNILGFVFQELSISFVFMLLTYLMTRKKHSPEKVAGWAFLFLAIALAGVFPFMISKKQRGFYLICAYPFFTLAFAHFILARINLLLNSFQERLAHSKFLKPIAVSLLMASIILHVIFMGKIGRDKAKIEDIDKLIAIIKPHSALAAHPSVRDDLGLHGYLYRYAYINVDPFKPLERPYFLIKKGWDIDLSPLYTKSNIQLNLYDLYERSTSDTIPDDRLRLLQQDMVLFPDKHR